MSNKHYLRSISHRAALVSDSLSVS